MSGRQIPVMGSMAKVVVLVEEEGEGEEEVAEAEAVERQAQ